MKHDIIIIGAGGHGKVVAEAAMHTFNIIGFADDSLPLETEIIAGIKVIAPGKGVEKVKSPTLRFSIAIGDNVVRKNIFDSLCQLMKPAVIIHPSAVVSVYAKIGPGTVVLANAVVNAGAQIGENCIINSFSLVDHDTIIGNHSHIAQGTVIGSNCKITDLCTTELGQRIKSFSSL